MYKRQLQERLERAALEARGLSAVPEVGAGDTPMARLFGCCADDEDKAANVEMTGAARLYRAASPAPPGWATGGFTTRNTYRSHVGAP